MATLHAFYSSDYCSSFEPQIGNPSESRRFEDLPTTATSKKILPSYCTLQSTGDFNKTENFADLVHFHALTDCLNLIESHWGYTDTTAIALLTFTQYLGGHHNA